MRGASSSAVHELVVEVGAGHVYQFVLRRFTDVEWLGREPDLAAREAEALTLLEGTSLVTPRLIAVDVDGEHCDVPAVLMSRLPGRPLDAPDDIESLATRLAEPLPRIHETLLPPRAAIPDYRPYYVDDARRGELRPPRGPDDPASWERAIEVLIGRPPSERQAVLLHRDYHAGNVLWQRGRLTGVVDWVNASRGPADADLGHCRLNLALDHGLDAADSLLAAHRALTGEGEYHPYWDVVAAVGMLPEHHDLSAADSFVARAVAAL
jgi:aminoglycoside phosphotransferase (APT) family kinase protein